MKNKPIAIAAMALSATLALAACTAETPEQPGGSDELIPVKVGTIPIVHAAALVLGIEKGFFEEEGLDVEFDTAAGGAAIVPGLTSGEFQFGLANPVSPMLAASQGLDIVLVANADHAEANPVVNADGWVEAPDVVLVREDSGIESAADLNGRSVAVNTFKGIAELTVKSAADRLGADSSTFDLVEVGFPDMLGALESGAVDAIVVSEPFYTIARGADTEYRGLFSYMSEAGPELPGDVYFATREYAEANPDVISAFAAAAHRSNAYAQAHKDEARAILSTYTSIDAATAEQIFLPTWYEDENAPFNLEGLQALADLMVTYGVVDSAPDIPAMSIVD
jgi:NitT/TauT family transport system substrate-binding protein